ncbi:P-loop containing nucleoside triphosphate hydrolase protein [Hysterangium stoloniferum]|nr:P-loop containing nucleoside triphosphate hydrolase protein [Hysterangium stoloniferum]
MAQAFLLNALSEFLPPPAQVTPVYGPPTVTQLAAPTTPPQLANESAAAGSATLGIEPLAISSLPALLLSLAIKNQDVLKLMIIGTVIETSRRFANTIWNKFWEWFVNAWYLTITFESNDESYEWMMVWLSKQSIWSHARAMQISTLSSRQTQYSAVELREDDFLDDEVQGLRKKRRMAYRPVHDATHWLKYKGVWISAVLAKPDKDDANAVWRNPSSETLILNIHTRDRSIMRALLKEAKNNYKVADENAIGLYNPTSYDEWHRTSSRKKRPLSSVILEPEFKEMILDDAIEFLSSEKWYTDRGMFFNAQSYGVPGSGKTSLIHSIAGELDLDVYVVSLAKKGLDDSSLNELFCNLPERSILLIEDIDAAFQRGITARAGLSGSNSNPEDSDSETDLGGNSDSGITLSGLLNALDGIAAAEGRILFATTNRYSALDEALRRPGRMDLHVEFKHATRWQMKELFKSFYPPRSEKEEEELRWNNRRTRSRRKLSAFTEAESEEFAEKFANAVPVDTFSVASLQGHLMLFKERPMDAVNAVGAWVEVELKKREAAEKAAKEKAEAAERAAEKKKAELERKEKEKEKKTKVDEVEKEKETKIEEGEKETNGEAREVRAGGISQQA